MTQIEILKLAVYILSTIIVIGAILTFVKNGIEYIIFGGLSVIMLSASSYSYYHLPQYWNLVAIIPFCFAIGPTIMFIGLTGILDHEGLSQR